MRRCVAHHIRSLLLLARSSLYVRGGTQIKSVSTLKYSIAHDFVMTWDDLENIGHHTFSYEFWVVPEEHLIGFTRAPVNLKTNQKYMTQFMFGTFKVPATCVAIQVGLSPYATRRATRIVMDSCDLLSHTVSRL